MPDKFTQLLPILGALVAFLVAAVLVLYIFRLLFGRRIRSPGPRNRARRLDVVDVFDLDRERQLVIVRRDNIEHLLLIGGPNDVLVEGTINRVEGVLGRPVEQQRPAPPAAANWPTGPGGAPPREQPEAASPPGPAPKPAPVNLPPDLFAPAPAKPAPGPAAAPPPAGPRVSSPAAAPPPRPAPPRPPTPPFLARAQQRLAQPPKDEAAPPSAAPKPPEAPQPARPPAPSPAPVRPAAPPPAPPPAPPKPAAPPRPRPSRPPPTSIRWSRSKLKWRGFSAGQATRNKKGRR